jgi:hypothetical protein
MNKTITQQINQPTQHKFVSVKQKEGKIQNLLHLKEIQTRGEKMFSNEKLANSIVRIEKFKSQNLAGRVC